MALKMSPQMHAVLDFIRANGGSITAEGGGYWKAANGTRDPTFNTTQTIYALERAGELQRTHTRPEPWRDTYVLHTA